MDTVTIVLPAVSEGAISDGLIEITKAIDALDPDRVAHGFLGGEHGYGGHWDGAVFQMRPFCWCEREDCPWCGGCDCPQSAFHYFVDGREVRAQEYMDFYMRHVYGMTDAEMKAKGINHWTLKPTGYKARSAEANRRRSTRQDPVCDYCTGKGPFATNGAEPGRGAPNFWHKSSGFKVWWYKYIGRDMGTHGSCDWPAVVKECAAAIQGSRA